uniref:Uncharacterized protein n=1 Tax=Linum usitatissimum TaxID=4006 RepID=G8GJ70_LINUS|nr:hypothetical protein [Linum usitatissimum]
MERKEDETSPLTTWPATGDETKREGESQVYSNG